MAQNKTIQMPIVGGMRQDLSEHMAPPGTLVDAKNVRFPVSGEVESRRGTTALSASSNADVAWSTLGDCEFAQGIPGGFIVGAEGFSYLYDFDKDRLHVCGSYSNALPYGVFTTMAVEDATLDIGDSTPWPLSTAVGGGYVAVLWSGGNGAQDIESGQPNAEGTLRCQIFTEGGTLVTTISLQTYTTGWVLYDAVAGVFVIIAQEVVDQLQLAAAQVTLAASGATMSAFSDIATLTNAAAYWAAAPWPGIGWALIFQSAGTTATIEKKAALATVTSNNFTTNGIDGPLSVYADATHVYVGWVDVNVAGSNIARARVYNTSLVLTSGVNAIDIYTRTSATTLELSPPLFGTSVTSSQAFLVVGAMDDAATNAADTFTKAGVLTAAGSLTMPSGQSYGFFPTSAPFNEGMVWCRYQTRSSSDDFGNIYLRQMLLDFQNDRSSSSETFWRLRWPRIALAGEPFADPFPGDYSGGVAYLHLCHPVRLTNGHWLAGLQRLVRSEQPAGTTGWGLAIGEWLEFATEVRRPARTLGREVMVAGTLTLHGKGSFGTNNFTTPGLSEPETANQASGVDCGFFVEPSVIAPTQSDAADGNLTVGGVYQYRTVVEWIDGLGRRWRSRPSRALTVTMTSTNDTNTFAEVDDYTSWMRQGFANVGAVSNMVLHYYRTVDKGSTFYRVSPPQGAPVANVGSGEEFVDKMDDDVAASREVLYTDGGVLANDHPSSCRFIAIMEDRVWLGGLWDETQIQSSKTLVPGEPPQFSDSPAFRVVLPEKCTGLAGQDGVLVAFTEGAVYAVQGTGPNNQGQGAWESPRVVTRSTGAISGSFTLETSAGIFFQSLRGIEMIPRGMGEPVFVGAAIQDTLGTATVLSAAVIKSGTSSTARFVLGTTVVLVYDLETGAWSRDVYPVAIVAICDTEEGALLVQQDQVNGYGFLLEGQAVATDSTDNGPVGVSSTLEFSALRPFGIAGQGRFLAAIGMFDELTSGSSPGYQSGNATIAMSVDGFTDSGKAWDMSVFAAPDYRRREPLQVAGSAAKLTLTTAVNGWRFMGFTVEVDEVGGGRRMGETEQG